MILIKIDVLKLDKNRFFKGAKGTYCDLVLIETPDGEYGDYMVKQSVTKEEREAKLQMPILGNGKIIGQRSQNTPRNSAAHAQENLDEDVPF